MKGAYIIRLRLPNDMIDEFVGVGERAGEGEEREFFKRYF